MGVGETPASTFVGRGRELDELRRGLGEARHGRGRLFLISGEPGIGKTRLTEEFCELASSAGATVLWGRCWEGGGAPVYLPWMQALRSFVRRIDGEKLARITGSAAPYLTVLVPEMRERLPGIAEPPKLESEHERFALFEAVAELIVRLSEDVPVVVALDDIHAADGGTLQMLRYVAQQTRAAPVVLLGAYREVEARFAPGVEELVREVTREGTRIPLRGLGGDEVAQFVRRLAGRDVAPSLSAAIHRHTEGNPLFVDEIVRLLEAESRLDEDLPAALGVPEAVRATIARRIEHLSGETRRVLAAASVLGRDFEVSTLAAVAQTDVDSLVRFLAAAARAGVLSEPPNAFGRGSFAHALFRETLYEEIPPSSRAALHRAAAEAIERLAGRDIETRLAELAHHWHEAAPATGDRRRAIEYSRRAGDRAMSMYGYEDARSHYERALDAVDPAEVERRCDVLLALGEARWRGGDLAAGKESFRSAAELARSLGSPHRLAQAALGYGSGVTLYALHDVDPDVAALLTEAEMALGDEESALHVRVLARLSLEGLWEESVERREPVSARALEMAGRLGDDRVVLSALYARCQATWSPASRATRADLVSRLLALAERTRDEEMIYLAHEMRYRDRMFHGDLDGARIEIETCRRLAERLRVPMYRDHGDVVPTVFTLYGRGVIQEAADTINARLAAVPPPSAEYTAQLGSVLLWTLLYRGDFDTVASGLEGMRARFRMARPIVDRLLPLILCEAGRANEARAAFEQTIEAGPMPMSDMWVLPSHLFALACARLGDTAHARMFVDDLGPFADLIAFGGLGTSFGAVAHPLACLAALLRDWDSAFDLFEKAFRLNSKVQRPMAAVTLRDHANALLDRGHPGDAARAAGLAGDALAMMREMGMDGWIPGTEALQARARDAAGAAGAELRRLDEGGWMLAFGGKRYRIKDAKGLGYLAALIARPYEESHVLDLVASSDGFPAGTRISRTRLAELGLNPSRLDGTGPALDAEAKAAYRARLAELEEEREEAARWNDPERVARLEAEIDVITGEISRAVGLGGRDRTASPEAERARVNVSRAVKAAIRAISKHCPEGGRHLAGSIRTGWFCSYFPDPSDRLSWLV